MSNPYSKFIPGEEIQQVSAWHFGAMDAPSQLPQDGDKEAADPALLESVRQDAFADGFAQGGAQARLAAQREWADFLSEQGRETALQLAQLVDGVQTRLAVLEQSTAEQVLHLACELAKHIMRHEVQVNSQAVIAAVKEALACLASDARLRRVRLHPQDLAQIQDHLSPEFGGVMWVADEGIERGGCWVESHHVTVDATLSGRWQRALAALGLSQPWTESVSDA